LAFRGPGSSFQPIILTGLRGENALRPADRGGLSTTTRPPRLVLPAVVAKPLPGHTHRVVLGRSGAVGSQGFWHFDMARPALIVCEPSGVWATALRQASAGRDLPIVETRRGQDVWRQVTAGPASIVALAWTAQWQAEMAELADGLGRRFPAVRVIALVDRRLSSAAWLAYEFGVIHVCRSPRQVGAVVRLARRHLGANAAARHWPAMDERIEQIWQTLPWNFEEGLSQHE
jgi:hypothetical protein